MSRRLGIIVVLVVLAAAAAGTWRLSGSGVDTTSVPRTPAGVVRSQSSSPGTPEILDAPSNRSAVAAPRNATPSWLPVEDINSVIAAGDYPGQPEPGRVLMGASLPDNADPTVRHEGPAGALLGVRRSFFQWHQADGWLLEVVQSDLHAGRLPWASVKTPPWQEVADGLHDDELDALLENLKALRGPVWLTVHHEPEGGGQHGGQPDDPGGPEAHAQMNRHVRERMDALEIDNVALAPILMAWTFNEASGRDPDPWWVDDTYDFIGIDIYSRGKSLQDLNSWLTLRQWAAERNMDVAIGEWGVLGETETTLEQIRSFHVEALESSQNSVLARIVALSYWDEDTDPPEGWILDNDRLATFHELLSAPANWHWTDAS